LLAGPGGDLGGERATLALGQGWSRRWTARWKFEGGAVVCPVRDLVGMSVQAPPARYISLKTELHNLATNLARAIDAPR
jgi:hypothetical protein